MITKQGRRQNKFAVIIIDDSLMIINQLYSTLIVHKYLAKTKEWYQQNKTHTNRGREVTQNRREDFADQWVLTMPEVCTSYNDIMVLYH